MYKCYACSCVTFCRAYNFLALSFLYTRAMKTLRLLLLCLVSATFAYGQKVEVAGQLNTGLARFIGESAGKTTTILYSKNPEGTDSYTNSPYGNIFALSYGASVQLQRVTRNNLLLGVQAGAESLRNRINIDGVYVNGSS